VAIGITDQDIIKMKDQEDSEEGILWTEETHILRLIKENYLGGVQGWHYFSLTLVVVTLYQTFRIEICPGHHS